jgi:hypothetical protein
LVLRSDPINQNNIVKANTTAQSDVNTTERKPKPMKILRMLPVFFLLPFMVSCSGKGSGSHISSGRIDYRITYLNDNLDKKTLDVLPKKMKLIFNEKEALNNIEGFLGFYRLDAYTNFHTRKSTTLLKVFDKHYLFNGKKDEIMCCFDPMEGMEIRETGETRNIAGFNCRKATVFLPSDSTSFDIYYTGDIKLRHPNSTNPYVQVDGVLMEFELKLLSLRMRFTAEKYQPAAEVPDKADLPKETRDVSRDQMVEILAKLLN